MVNVYISDYKRLLKLTFNTLKMNGVVRFSFLLMPCACVSWYLMPNYNMFVYGKFFFFDTRTAVGLLKHLKTLVLKAVDLSACLMNTFKVRFMSNIWFKLCHMPPKLSRNFCKKISKGTFDFPIALTWVVTCPVFFLTPFFVFEITWQIVCWQLRVHFNIF